jgi:hypothetical protein
MPIKEAIFESKDEESAERIVRENVSVSREKERAAMAVALVPLQQLQVQQEIWELSLSEVILLLHVCCNPFSIYL